MGHKNRGWVHRSDLIGELQVRVGVFFVRWTCRPALHVRRLCFVFHIAAPAPPAPAPRLPLRVGPLFSPPIAVQANLIIDLRPQRPLKAIGLTCCRTYSSIECRCGTIYLSVDRHVCWSFVITRFPASTPFSRIMSQSWQDSLELHWFSRYRPSIF